MLPSSQDKKMLIQSMKKLTSHISNNQPRQREIFQSLSKTDLLKIISNLSDDNQYLRRISGLLLTELLYNNPQIKAQIIQLLQIYPANGRICLNPLPPSIVKYPSTFKKCIQLMKSELRQKQQDRFCWVINLDRKILQLEFLQYKKYSSFTFLDPNRNIFGFTHTAEGIPQTRQSKHNKTISNSSIDRLTKPKSIDHSGSVTKNQPISSGVSSNNNSFYKNYIDNRSRKAESPSSYRDFYQKKEINRPNTSKNSNKAHLYLSSSSSPYHYNTNNLPKSMNTIHTISQYAKMNKQASHPSHDSNYDQINTRKGSQIQPSKNNSDLRLELSLNRSLDMTPNYNGYNNGSNTLRAPVKEPYGQRPQTDRKETSPFKFKMSESGTFNSSVNEKYSPVNTKYPESTKNSASYISQHEKFYKKVKEILKR